MDKELVDFNESCARYLGAWDERDYLVLETKFFKSINSCIMKPYEMKFHSDGDWIKQVLDKIKKDDLEVYENLVGLENEKFIKELESYFLAHFTDTVEGIYYATIEVQNPYSSGDRGKEYGWCSNYQTGEMSRSEFSKYAKAVSNKVASKKFREYFENAGKIKIYTSRKKFKKAFHALTGNETTFID